MILTPETEANLPGVVCFVDTETRAPDDQVGTGNEEHSLWFGVAIAGRIEGGKFTRRRELVFHTREEFWAWVNSVRRPGERFHLFAHNLWFDLTILGFWEMFDRREWVLHRPKKKPAGRGRNPRAGGEDAGTQSGLLITEDPPSAVMVWHSSGWGLFAQDTLNLFDMPLARLAKLVGMEKLEFPTLDDPEAVWVEYCKRDVEVIREAVCQLVSWWKSQELGRWPITLAAGALQAWRYRFAHQMPDIPQQPQQREMERQAAYTGRTEALWVGSSNQGTAARQRGEIVEQSLFRPIPRPPFYLVDATSFYGLLLSEVSVPVQTQESWWETSGGELGFDNLGPDCLASVRIHHEVERFPCRRGDRVIWPTGTYDTVLCGDELGRAIRTGAIAHLYGAIRYKLAPIFNEFAWGIWEQAEEARQSGNKLVQFVAKSMLARLAGKFGQRGFSWADCPDVIPQAPWARWTEKNLTTGEVHQYRAISWAVQERIQSPDPDHSWPAIFAWVTAAGRETLRRWWETAGLGNCLYLATDALIVTRAGLDNLDRAGFMDETALGFLRVKDETDDLEIRGPSSYRFGRREVIAGRALSGELVSPGVVERLKFQKVTGTIAKGGGSTITVQRVRELIPVRDQAGTIDPDGWVVPPRVNLLDLDEVQGGVSRPQFQVPGSVDPKTASFHR